MLRKMKELPEDKNSNLTINDFRLWAFETDTTILVQFD